MCPHCPNIHPTKGQFYGCHKRHKGKVSHQEAQPGPTASSSIAPVIQAAPVIKILQLDKTRIQESLDTEGFAIFQISEGIPDLSILSQIAHDPTTLSEGIDNHGQDLPDAEQLDSKRRYFKLAEHIPGLFPMFVYLNDILVAIGPRILNEWRQKVGWYLLWSQPGLERQIWHKDYDVVPKLSNLDVDANGKKWKRQKGARDFALEKPAMPLSLEISFSNNTTWWGPGPDHLEHDIPAGWCVLFRGDTEHAGGGNPGDSTDLCLRAHSYFDHPSLSAQFRYAKHMKAIFYTDGPTYGDPFQS